LPLPLQSDPLAETLASTFTASPNDPEDTSSSRAGIAVKESDNASAKNRKRKLEERGATDSALPRARPAKGSFADIGVSNPPPDRLLVKQARAEKETKQRRRAEWKPEKPQENGSQDDDVKRTKNSHKDFYDNKAARRLDQTATKSERKNKRRTAHDNREPEIVHRPLLHRPKDQVATSGHDKKLGVSVDGEAGYVPDVDLINRDPPKSETRRRRRTAPTLGSSVMIEEPKIDFFDGEREGQENAETKLREQRHGPSQRKLKKYAKAAALRGLSVEKYIERKVRKRLKKSERATSFTRG
jgi:hypothetical protein